MLKEPLDLSTPALERLLEQTRQSKELVPSVKGFPNYVDYTEELILEVLRLRGAPGSAATIRAQLDMVGEEVRFDRLR